MRMISEERILVVLDGHGSTFMENDVEILRKHFTVDVVYRPDYPRIRHLILDVARRLLWHRPQLIYAWFVKPWDTAAITFIARLVGVKSVLHVGGYDIANMPEFEYGMMRLPGAKPWIQFALNSATLVNTSSESLMSKVLDLAHPRRTQVNYPGVDVDAFQPGNGAKQNLVITTGTVGRVTSKIKGLETFAGCSKLMPQVQFAVVGPVADLDVLEHLKSLGGSNLSFTSAYAARGEMLDWCQRAKVYVQASAVESFGLAVAEAMACECIPVVTRVGGLPEVAGDSGFYTTYGDVEATAEAIEQALGSSNGPAARRRVLENFTLAQREERLLTQLDNLLA
jgi:glycosyltransferase involved in cell wall biosynthesis